MPITPDGWPIMNGSDLVYQTPAYTQHLAAVLAATVGQGTPLPTDPPLDTGWVDLALLNGVTAPSNERPQVRRINNAVWLRGIVTATSETLPPSTSTVVATVPASYRQPINVLFKATGQNGNTDAMVIISYTNGDVTLRTGPTQGSYYSLQFSWLVD